MNATSYEHIKGYCKVVYDNVYNNVHIHKYYFFKIKYQLKS